MLKMLLDKQLHWKEGEVMPEKITLVGKRFGRLTVIAESYTKRGSYVCKCDCGNTTKPIQAGNLRHGRQKSCGCLKVDRLKKKIAIKHNDSNSRLYLVWQAMKQRCTNKNHPNYRHYGGRGVQVCKEWLNSFENFRNWSMCNGYDPSAKQSECTLDRIDVNGNYCPENCR